MRQRFVKCLFLSWILLLSLGYLNHTTSIAAEKSGALQKILSLQKNTSPLYTLELSDLDSLGRAGMAHIRLKESDQPRKKRSQRLTYNPSGWHNYKFFYEDGRKKAWLMSRGHLIGYQFSGLEDEARNLVAMTNWLNAGNYKGMNARNPDSMLFYEHRLDNWLALHRHYYLDYAVYPIYQDQNLVPHQIMLAYFGIDPNGKKIKIQLGGGKEKINSDGVTVVILENQSPNAILDYQTGRATNTIESARVQEAKEKAQVQPTETQLPASQDRVVYVARKGRAEVYWYSLDNMPETTNFTNVVQMTEAQAISLGKRHTTKE